jgi:molybdopterin biosynthesis enzyme MoaB
MLGRGVSVIRGGSLIINLPGSPKAVRENLSSVAESLRHGLDILTGQAGECGSTDK